MAVCHRMSDERLSEILKEKGRLERQIKELIVFSDYLKKLNPDSMVSVSTVYKSIDAALEVK